MLTEETTVETTYDPDNFISYSCDAGEESNALNNAALFNFLNEQSSSENPQCTLELESSKIMENTSEKLSQTTASSEKSTLKGELYLLFGVICWKFFLLDLTLLRIFLSLIHVFGVGLLELA